MHRDESRCGTQFVRHNFNLGSGSPLLHDVQADGKQYVVMCSGTAIYQFGLFEPVKPVPLPKIVIQ